LGFIKCFHSFREYPYSPHRREYGSGFYVTKKMKLSWNSKRGGEVLEKNPFCGGGVDISEATQ